MIGDLLKGGRAKGPGFAESEPGGGDLAGSDGVVTLPELPASLAQVVVFDRAPKPSFSRTGKSLGMLTEEQAAEIDRDMRKRTASGSGLAQRRGMVTEQQAEAIDRARALRVHVDQRHRGRPAFDTWVRDLKALDIPVEIVTLSAQDLVELQRVHQAPGGEEDGAMLSQARAMLQNLALMKASDLHIKLKADHAEFEARIKGRLRALPTLTMNAAEGLQLVRAMCTGLTTSKEPTFNPHDFQNAQINGLDELPGTGLSSVRIVRGPSYPKQNGGQFLVARLQPGEAVEKPVGRKLEIRKPAPPPGVMNLPGLTPLQLQLVNRLIRMPYGICFVNGPTGSGKTTALQELMKQQGRIFPELRQVSLEDPVEYPMSWAIQLEGPGEEWQEILRHILRMDPDTIFIGEIRSEHEAIAAIQAAMTGHFCWTTTHVTDPYEVFKRLEMLDNKKLALVETLDKNRVVGLIGVRLVETICPHCSKPMSECSEEEIPTYIRQALATWADDGDVSRVRLTGDGCDKCDGGTTGRKQIAEIVVPDTEFYERALKDGIPAARKWHRQREGSDLSMLGNAMPFVLAGEVSPMDVNKGVSEVVARGQE